MVCSSVIILTEFVIQISVSAENFHIGAPLLICYLFKTTDFLDNHIPVNVNESSKSIIKLLPYWQNAKGITQLGFGDFLWLHTEQWSSQSLTLWHSDQMCSRKTLEKAGANWPSG